MNEVTIYAMKQYLIEHSCFDDTWNDEKIRRVYDLAKNTTFDRFNKDSYENQD